MIVSSIRTKNAHKNIEKICSNTEELIKANWNKKNIELLVQGLQSDPLWIQGTIQSSLRNQNRQDDESENETTTEMVIIQKTDNKTIAIPMKSIVSIQGESLRTTFTQEKPEKTLQIFYKNQSNSNGWAFMKYLSSGLTWVPSYE